MKGASSCGALTPIQLELRDRRYNTALKLSPLLPACCQKPVEVMGQCPVNLVVGPRCNRVDNLLQLVCKRFPLSKSKQALFRTTLQSIEGHG